MDEDGEHGSRGGRERPDDVPRRDVLRAMGVGTGSALTGFRSLSDGSDGDVGGGSALAETRRRTGWYATRELVTDEQCMYPTDGALIGEAHDFELYGPTPINAQTSNGSLAVAVDDAGTVTVFKWPRPSFYDQVKYKTSDRSEPRYGAYANEGAFLGLEVTTSQGTRTTWLREWETDQSYVHDLSDTVQTRYTQEDLGLVVTVRDTVAPEDDVLVRDVTVRRLGNSPVESARLLAYGNFNCVASKKPKLPTRGWCEEFRNADHARFDPGSGAVVHEHSEVDVSTDEPTSVAVAMATDGEVTDHQVGGDAYEPSATPAGEAGPTRDAYDAASQGTFPGNDEFVGQTTAVVATDLEFRFGNRASETVYLAGGPDARTATDLVRETRARAPRDVERAKREWVGDLLADAPLPDVEDGPVLELARRALVTLVTTYDPESGAVVASVATQAPYGEDWVRDGAFFNYALDLIGRHDWVAKRNRWYAALQQSESDPQPTYPDVPPGNWPMNHYADGVAGGPIPWEVDETGYGLWTLWDHYSVTGDEEYLADVWPAIRRAAEFLVDYRDPRNDLQGYASEDDHPEPTQTITGAATVWLGLDSAAKAAAALGEEGARERYVARREELAAAIEDLLYDGQAGYYGKKKGFPSAPVAWPVCFRPFEDDRMATHLDSVWEATRPTFAEPEAGNLDSGLYEAKALVPLAQARRESGPGSLADVRRGLDWIAEVHATPDTRIMGEIWLRDGEEIVTSVSQPHVWEQTLFYLAALEAYPPLPDEEVPEGCGGALAVLRERNAPDG